MKRVVGLGGIFFKAKDPKALYEWYRKHLGIEFAPDGSGAMWPSPRQAQTERLQGTPTRDADHPEIPGCNVFAIFPDSTTYLGSGSFMLNFRVDDLTPLVTALREEGVEVEKVEEHDYGKFGWLTDLEGNRVELWEPAKE